MAISIVGTGTADSASPWAPTVAGTVLANDIIAILVEQNGNGPAVAASGYAHVTGSPVNVDTTTQLSVLWKRAAGGETSATVTGPTDHAMTRTITFRGVKDTGDPWNVSPQALQDAVSNTTVTWPAVTTTVADCLIMFCVATGRDLNSTTNLGTLSGGTGLSSITERMDNWTNTLAGGGVGLITATKAAAGSTGTPTATLANADLKALMTIALEPAGATPPVTDNGDLMAFFYGF